MRTANCLRLDCRVPPRIEDENVVRGREIEAGSTRLQADQKDRAFLVRLEPFYGGLSIDGLPIQVFVYDSLGKNRDFSSRLRAGFRELRKNESLMALGNDFLELAGEEARVSHSVRELLGLRRSIPHGRRPDAGGEALREHGAWTCQAHSFERTSQWTLGIDPG